jgi:hypothetical protein
MLNWMQQIDAWRALAALKIFPPASEASLEDARQLVKDLPIVLEGLYRASNGLSAGAFKLLPIYDPSDVKRTWDSIQRANDARATRFLGRSSQILERFIVFADIGVGRAGAFDRTDGSIWFEDEDQLRQTNLSLDRFIEANLREIAGLA